MNLRPLRYTAHRPSAVRSDGPNSIGDLNSPRVLWKILGRTIYRPSEEWPHWLRNPSPINGDRFWLYRQKNLTHSEKEVLEKLQVTYGLTYLPNEERFYDMFRISRKDFCHMLDFAKDKQEREAIILDRIYSVKNSAVHGRRGVMSLGDTYDYLRKVEMKREKVDEFMSKFGQSFGMTGR